MPIRYVICIFINKQVDIYSLAKLQFLNYWSKENSLIDYFLVDYSIAIAYYKFDEFRNVIDENPVDNPEVCKMTKMLNLEFGDTTWNEIYHSQVIHKLSWKLPLAKGNTIANYIINDL